MISLKYFDMTRLRLAQCSKFHGDVLKAAVDYNIAYTETEYYRLAYEAFKTGLTNYYHLDLEPVQSASKDLERIFRIFLRQLKSASISINSQKSESALKLLGILDYKSFFATSNRGKRNICIANFFDKLKELSADIVALAGVDDECKVLEEVYYKFYNEYRITSGEFREGAKSKNQALKQEVNKKFVEFVEFINALINVSHDENLYSDFCNVVNGYISDAITTIRQCRAQRARRKREREDRAQG